MAIVSGQVVSFDKQVAEYIQKNPERVAIKVSPAEPFQNQYKPLAYVLHRDLQVSNLLSLVRKSLVLDQDSSLSLSRNQTRLKMSRFASSRC